MGLASGPATKLVKLLEAVFNAFLETDATAILGAEIDALRPRSHGRQQAVVVFCDKKDHAMLRRFLQGFQKRVGGRGIHAGGIRDDGDPVLAGRHQ